MKTIIAAILLFAFTSIGSELTNGVFYVDKSVNCVIVPQSGASTTNLLEAGKTYQSGDAILEIKTTEQTLFYFSNGLLMQVGKDSSFAIQLFDQEVENLNAPPRRAQFGTHLLNISLDLGEFCLIYLNKNENSRVNAVTQFAQYELVGGKYYFRVGKSALVYVLEGSMSVHGDKSKVDVVDKGSLAIAVPFTDPESGLEDKFLSSLKKPKQDELERFTAPLLAVERLWGDVNFFVIGGKVIGFYVK